MKPIILACLFIVGLAGAKAQPIKADLFVAYDYVHQFDITQSPTVDSVVLFANVDHQVALYRNVSYGKESDPKAEVEDGDFGMVVHNKVSMTDGKGTPLFTDFLHNVLQERKITLVNGRKEAFIVEEKALNIRWSLQEEYKEIGGRFSCQKAIGTLRGRTYVAWFDRSIPVPLGPWKLHGLPGLLIEVEDTQQQVAFRLRSISYPCKIDASIHAPIEGKHVSLQEFVAIEEKVAEGYIQYLQSRMPRGAVTRITSVSKTPGLEVNYSFE
ncbi:MAG: GLPGLI family protein [Lewinellaceae bacterium]|nr:GLPGLI family protein [Lewinellaceae bacterium]